MKRNKELVLVSKSELYLEESLVNMRIKELLFIFGITTIIGSTHASQPDQPTALTPTTAELKAQLLTRLTRAKEMLREQNLSFTQEQQNELQQYAAQTDTLQGLSALVEATEEAIANALIDKADLEIKATALRRNRECEQEEE